MHGLTKNSPGYLTPIVIAGFFSVVLSVWAGFKTVVVNPDAICYLLSAASMSKGLSVASHLCPQASWPFYSLLIFGLTQLTHVSYTTSAYCLNGFFSLISVITFMLIVNSLTHQKRVLILAAVVILLAHEFNGVRVEIVRDHGFWAFYLTSLFFALRYVKNAHGKWTDALLWAISLIAATLFRIEGAVFLVLFPFIVFLDRRLAFRQRALSFLRLNTLTIFVGIALSAWIATHPEQSLGRLTELSFQLLHGMTEFIQSFERTANGLARYVLSLFSARDATWILMLLFIGWYLVSVISNLSPIYAALIIYAWCKKLAGFPRESRVVIWGYILINIFITLFFLVDHLFLAKRYLIALSLTLMLWVPFALDHLIKGWHQRKWPVLLVGFIMLVYGASGIFDLGHSKKYIREGGDWLSTHATPEQTIYSNDYQLLYYSNHFGDLIFSEGVRFQNLNTIANGKWRQYDYVALRVNEKDLKKNPVLNEINLSPVAVFQNDRGDTVRIYETHSGRKRQ
ncbi:MAG TPA: hypothetical protein VLJ15_07520 [Gammaproteobacteria bacterium]|nr:hypothetical protein [Gammaproteobacteria bacterium]